MKEMTGELQQLVEHAPPEKSVRPLSETGPRNLTFEEKRKLSVVRLPSRQGPASVGPGGRQQRAAITPPAQSAGGAAERYGWGRQKPQKAD